MLAMLASSSEPAMQAQTNRNALEDVYFHKASGKDVTDIKAQTCIKTLATLRNDSSSLPVMHAAMCRMQARYCSAIMVPMMQLSLSVQ